MYISWVLGEDDDRATYQMEDEGGPVDLLDLKTVLPRSGMALEQSLSCFFTFGCSIVEMSIYSESEGLNANASSISD